MNKSLKRIVLSGIFAALIFAATLIKIPFPITEGYVNLGDCMIIISAAFLGPLYGFAAASIGSALCDIIYFPLYAPATFIIKGLMAVAMALILRSFKSHQVSGIIISSAVAEIIMVGGYFAFEIFIYGFPTAIADLIPNGFQGIVGAVSGVCLYFAAQKSGIKKYI